MNMNNNKYLLNKLYETSLGDLFIKKELGRGKSGYSYLATLGKYKFVLKIMHNEPCPYYQFGDNKVLLEMNAYQQLRHSGIKVPELLDYNPARKYIVKEYIDGTVASDIIARDKVSDSIFEQLFKMFHLAKNKNINIDYFPSNFVWQGNHLFYIDYECNPYMGEWDLLNWGIYYWINNDGFKKYLSTGDILYINESLESGIPIKNQLYKRVEELKCKFEMFGVIK